jgi:hypothetical protein
VEQPAEFFIGARVIGLRFAESRLFDFQPELFVQEHFSFDARNVLDARIFVALF